VNPIQDGENPCDGALHSCLCQLPNGHEGPHSCVCGGRWEGSGEGVRIIALPKMAYDNLSYLSDLLYGNDPTR
jgi:hypothetical protein